MLSACIISRVNRLTVSSIFKKSEGSLGKAVAAIKAEFSKERNFLKIDNHILDQFELGLKISFSRFLNSVTKFWKSGSKGLTKRGFEFRSKEVNFDKLFLSVELSLISFRFILGSVSGKLSFGVKVSKIIEHGYL